MRRPDLLILIAVWKFLTAAGALAGITAIAVFAFPEVLWQWGPALTGGLFGLSIATFVLAAYCGLGVAAGIGLIIGKEWGRVLAIVHAAIDVINIPIGTVIGVLSIIYLVRSDVKEYFVPAAK